MCFNFPLSIALGIKKKERKESLSIAKDFRQCDRETDTKNYQTDRQMRREKERIRFVLHHGASVFEDCFVFTTFFLFLSVSR